MPGLWRGEEIEGRKLPAKGYATYRLQIKVPHDSVPLVIGITDVMSVHRLFVNGRLRSEDGTMSAQEDEEILGQLQMFFVQLQDLNLKLIF